MKTVLCGLSALLLVLCCSLAVADITGRVADEEGAGLAKARVFAEPGVEKEIIEGAVSADGTFVIPGDFFGNVGIFAWAPGHAFSGTHLTLAAGDDPGHLQIRLGQEARLSGKVVDEKGHAVAGVRLITLAITAPVKVGIPLSKLEPFGFPLSRSDDNGAFQLSGLPKNGQVALKFEHPLYAREAVTGLASDSGDVRIVLHRGVALRGTVLITGTDRPVSGAVVIAHNTQPPHDTAATATDSTGSFRLLLKPGVYLLQAHSAGRISPGMQRVDLTGELPEVSLRLPLSETGIITGSAHDAKTGQPIAGVRFFLETRGQAGGVARTGRQGQFQLNAPEGSNTIRLDPVPGYQAPEPAALQVMVPPSGTLELPGFWLAPTPDYRVQVLQPDNVTPVPGACAALLQPRQFGWQHADARGSLFLQFAAQPKDGRLIGFVEHPREDAGALFSLVPPLKADASVALHPFGRVTGRVVNSKGQALPGVVVGSLYADDSLEEPLTLWRQVTDKDGCFDWRWVPAGVPQRCVAVLGSLSAEAAKDFNPAPGEKIDLGEIAVPSTQEPVQKKPVHWTELPCQSGAALSSRSGRATAAFFCTVAEAPLFMEALSAIAEKLSGIGVDTLLAVSGDYQPERAPVPVYRSETPETVTRLYTPSGSLFLETPGIPPFSAFRAAVKE